MSHGRTAEALVLGDRNAGYGPPADDFGKTAKIWSGLLINKLRPGIEITPLDAVLMMVGLKLAREMHKHKDDNLIDGHGYLDLAEWLVDGFPPEIPEKNDGSCCSSTGYVGKYKIT